MDRIGVQNIILMEKGGFGVCYTLTKQVREKFEI